MKTGKVGELDIRRETEFEPGYLVGSRINPDKQLEYEGYLGVEECGPSMPTEPISTLVIMPPGPLDDYITIPERLKRKMEYYLKHFDGLLRRIRRHKDFQFENEHISKEVPERQKAIVSYNARYLLLKAFEPRFKEFWHPFNICFWYCFRHDTLPLPPSKVHFIFKLGGSLDLDLSLQSGAVQLDKESSTYTVCGIPYHHLRKNRNSIDEYLHGLITGFRLTTYGEEGIEKCSIAKLIYFRKTMPMNTCKRIHFGGRKFTAIRDDEVALQTDQTVSRALIGLANDDEALSLLSCLHVVHDTFRD